MIKNIFLTFLCTLSLSLSAQVVTQFTSRWENGIVSVVSMENDKYGNYYLIGDHYVPTGSGGASPTTNVFIEKYNSNGVSQWLVQSNSTQSNNSVQFGSSAIDSSGNIFVMCSFVGTTISVGSLSYTGNASGDLDFCYLKISPTGTLMWIKGVDVANSMDDKRLSGSIRIAKNQDLLMTGGFYDQMTLGTVNLPGNIVASFPGSPYPPCGFIARLTNNGDFLWAKQLDIYNSQQSNSGNGLSQLHENQYGEIFTIAYLDSGFVLDGTNVLSTISSGSADKSAIVKLDTNGTILDYKIMHSPYGLALRMKMDKCGEPIVYGDYLYTVSIDSLTTDSSATWNVFVTKFDRDLNCKWLKDYGSSGGDLAAGMAINNQNEIFFAIEFWGTLALAGNYTPSPSTVIDLAILKLDAQGELVWVLHTDGGGYGSHGDVAVAPDNTVYLVGNFRNSKNFQGHTVTSMNSQHSDVFVGKILDTTIMNIYCSGGNGGGVGLKELDLPNQFNIYPNPANSFFVLQVETEFGNNAFQLITTTGKVIKSFHTAPGLNDIDITDVSNGIYFIRHTRTGQTRKIIID